MQLSRRNDINEYLICSLESRLIKVEIPTFNTLDIKKGDVLIDNDLYGEYSREIQMALKYITNFDKIDVVGRIKEDEILLINYLPDGQYFMLKYS